ncbi:MAG: tripartite tricarboxylate transporter substrate-binding protein, partial [Alphaproteobacteria bacterium]|nr:tripartite tricarboxylate transporter substrate-binding protein [Alphaproteobacteria bacterium]
AADTVARNVGLRVSEILGQQVIIDNRTGGNSIVAANAVMQAPRDGQTFLIDAANQVTNEFLIKDLPFDYQKTWIPVTRLSDFPQVLAVKSDFPAKTLEEYIAMAKAKPGVIGYGTPPAAGMAHMAGAEFQRRAGIKLIHAPFRGGADAARDIGAGAIDSVLITTNSIRPPPAAGRCRGDHRRQGQGEARRHRRRPHRQYARRVQDLARHPAYPAGQADRRGRHQARIAHALCSKGAL